MLRLLPSLALLASVVLPVQAHAGLLELLRGDRDLEVITVTDVSAKGFFMPPASPADPQYYIAASLGFRELGGILAGTEEPPAKDVIYLISAELAKRGYLPATSQSKPPSLMLVYTWGTLNADKFYGGDPTLPPGQRNRGQIVSFLGGRKVGIRDDHFSPLNEPILGLDVQNYAARTLLEAAGENFYVIVVSAYDIEDALQKKRRPPVWTTRICTPSLGFDLGNVLPAMLAIGGEQFGRDTPRPVWINATDKFKPNVRLGEIQLLGYLKSEPLPVTDAADTVIEKK